MLRLDTMLRLQEAVVKVLTEAPEAIVLDFAETAGVEDDLSLVTLAALGEQVAAHTAGELLLAAPSLRTRVALQRCSPLLCGCSPPVPKPGSRPARASLRTGYARDYRQSRTRRSSPAASSLRCVRCGS
ncbi:MAG: hypothetical protein ACRDRV_11585 [Pseudonocardiaceae bacterium]